MRSLKTILGGAALLALAACGGGDADSSGTAANTAGAGGEAATSQASAEVRMQPGQWEITQQTVNVTAPGMPAGAADMLKTPPVTVKTCISEEQASKPGADLFTGKQDPNCSHEGFKAGGGKVSGTITCKGGNTGNASMAMEGEFGPTEFNVEMKTTTEAQGAQMTMEMRSSGRRIGECPAGGEAAG